MLHSTLCCLIAIPLLGLVLLKPLSAQEKVRKTETISTVPLKVDGYIGGANSGRTNVKCDAVFTPTQVAVDGTVTGFLTILVPDATRQRLRGLPGSLEIPSTVTAKEVRATLVPKTHCPDIKLAVPEVNISIQGIDLHFDRMVLHLAESQQRLSRALCIWTERISKGKNNTSLVPYINLLIKGDDEEVPVQKPG